MTDCFTNLPLLGILILHFLIFEILSTNVHHMITCNQPALGSQHQNPLCENKFETCRIFCPDLPCLRDSAFIPIWGTVIYSSNSNPCVAALHNLRISAWNMTNRIITINPINYTGMFHGSLQHGIPSYNSIEVKHSPPSYEFISERIEEQIIDVTVLHEKFITIKPTDDLPDGILRCYIRRVPNDALTLFKTYPKRNKFNGILTENDKSQHYKLERTSALDYKPTLSCQIDISPSSEILTILLSCADFYPYSFTQTVSVGDKEIVLKMRPANDLLVGDYLWLKDGITLTNKAIFQDLFYFEKTFIHFKGAMELHHTGIYTLKYANNNNVLQASMRLIVRSCPEYYFGKFCNETCLTCYNGGICHDITGDCICPPGYYGPVCEYKCGGNIFGKNCEASFGMSNSLYDLRGIQFCLPDPYGCSCALGWTGLDCKSNCTRRGPNIYGASCNQRCGYCIRNEGCNNVSGECKNGCQQGWEEPYCKTRIFNIKDKPIIVNVTSRSLSFRWNHWKLNLDSRIKKKYIKSYYVEYKEEHSPYWNQWIKIMRQSSKIRFHYANINNLLSKTPYVIRIRLVDFKNTLHLSTSPELTVTTL